MPRARVRRNDRQANLTAPKWPRRWLQPMLLRLVVVGSVWRADSRSFRTRPHLRTPPGWVQTRRLMAPAMEGREPPQPAIRRVFGAPRFTKKSLNIVLPRFGLLEYKHTQTASCMETTAVPLAAAKSRTLAPLWKLSLLIGASAPSGLPSPKTRCSRNSIAYSPSGAGDCNDCATWEAGRGSVWWTSGRASTRQPEAWQPCAL